MIADAFAELAERLRDPLLVVDSAGVVEKLNRAARQTLGVGEGDDLTSRVEEPETLRHQLARASRSKESLPGSLVVRDGERWRVDMALIEPAETSDDGAILLLHLRATAGMRFDALNAQIEKLHGEIRQRIRLEQEREELLAREKAARADAEESSRLKDEFLAAISHELRTPLSAILGWLDLLRLRGGDPELRERGLEVLDRNARAQMQLVEDLIDVSRVVSGRMRLDLQPVDLAKIAHQAVDSVRPAAEAKNIRLQVVGPREGFAINADPDRLLQIVWNLLSNATKFTPKGGRIQVVLRQINSHVEVEISDTGEGIPEDVLPYVFDRFRQADGSTTRRHGGLGLGLAIVRHLTELHGGVVMAHSDGPGRGATFTVSLPLPIFERKAAVAGPAEPTPEGVLGGCHVLLIEDHEDSRELLESILQTSGAEVTAVASAADAFTAFSERLPSVVISDIELPEEDGFTLMRKLRDYERQEGLGSTPAIAVTAHSISEARVRALRCGYQTFMVKPIHPPELVALVESMCGLRERDLSEE